MELVYLWVEDYKNIHKQGFNLVDIMKKVIFNKVRINYE